MKFLNAVFICGALLLLLSCQKSQKASPAATGNGGAPAFAVSSVPDSTGYQRVYNVIHRSYYGVGSSLGTGTVDATFHCTVTTIGDTLIPPGTVGKLYRYTTDSVQYGTNIRAYSYYNNSDSTWNLTPLMYSYFVKRVGFKFPLTVGKKWTIATIPYGDGLEAETLTSQSVSNHNYPCFVVSGGCTVMVNYQTYFYKYYVGKKGILKYSWNDLTISNTTTESWTDEYELTLASTNF